LTRRSSAPCKFITGLPPGTGGQTGTKQMPHSEEIFGKPVFKSG